MTAAYWVLVDGVAVTGGIVVLVGGIAGLTILLNRTSVAVAHLDRLGFVVGPDKNRSKVYLPVIISNEARKPRVITEMVLAIEGLESHRKHEFSWALFWSEAFASPRKRESYCSPIPVQGFTSVERNVEFHCEPLVVWKPETHECYLRIRLGRRRREKDACRFYVRPSEKRVTTWNAGCTSSRLDDIPIFVPLKHVPEEGT